MTVKEQAINAIVKLIPEDKKILFGSPKISVSELQENCSWGAVKKTITIEWEEILEGEIIKCAK